VLNRYPRVVLVREVPTIGEVEREVHEATRFFELEAARPTEPLLVAGALAVVGLALRV